MNPVSKVHYVQCSNAWALSMDHLHEVDVEYHCRVFVQADYVQMYVKICLSSWCQIDGENALKLKQTKKEYFFTRERNHSQKKRKLFRFSCHSLFKEISAIQIPAVSVEILLFLSSFLRISLDLHNTNQIQIIKFQRRKIKSHHIF